MAHLKAFTFIPALLIISFFSYSQTETRNLSSFQKLKAGGSLNVVLEKGDSEKVTLEGKNIDLGKIKTEVKNGTLDIYLEKGNYRNFDLTVYVFYNNLEEIHKSGSGNLSAKSDISGSNMALHLSGSGNSDLDALNGNSLKINLSGSGNLKIGGGMVNDLSISQSGSGNIKSSVEAENCRIQKSGSGNVAVNVNKTLEVNSSGSGNVKYQGSPSINKVKFSGSGELVKL